MDMFSRCCLTSYIRYGSDFFYSETCIYIDHIAFDSMCVPQQYTFFSRLICRRRIRGLPDNLA